MNSFKAFTLVEMLITVAILGMLVSTILILVDPIQMRNRAQDAVRREDVAVIAGALERYYADNNRYPTSFPAAGAALTNPLGTITYLREVPTGPDGDVYTFSNPNGDQTFQICADVEDPPSSPPFCITNAF